MLGSGRLLKQPMVTLPIASKAALTYFNTYWAAHEYLQQLKLMVHDVYLKCLHMFLVSLSLSLALSVTRFIEASV